MKHTLIAAISKHNIISYYSKSYPNFKDMIGKLIEYIQSITPYINLGIHIRTGDEYKNTHSFSSNDYVVIYYNKQTNFYNVGKWNENTLRKHDDFKDKMLCDSGFELLNKLNNFITNNKSTIVRDYLIRNDLSNNLPLTINDKQNENRLQEQESFGREQSNRRGTSIEIGEVEISITSGRDSYKRKSSYCQD